MNDNTSVKGKNRALCLYDSLVPKIQASSYRYDNCFTSINQKDILKEIQIQKLIDLDISADDKQYNPTVLKHKNRVLKFQLQTLQQNLEVVKWYISSLEEGIDGAEVMEKYHTLKQEHESLQEKHAKYKSKMESKIAKSDKKIERLFDELKNQQEKCVKPLLEEVKEKSEIIVQ